MRFLLDEMFPRAAAAMLREDLDHDALHVGDVGLRGADDVTVATFARSEHRAVATENLSDYAPESDLVLVCVQKRTLPSGGAQARALAALLDRWAKDNPGPYVGQHWPT